MITVLGAIAGFLAVAFGAFGAHALGESLSEKASGWCETATLYLLVHAALVTVLSAQNAEKFGLAAGMLLAGAVLFAATLYAMALGCMFCSTWITAKVLHPFFTFPEGLSWVNCI